MSREILFDFLPQIYRRLLPGFFASPVAEERNATCANCAMCPPPGAPAEDAVPRYFRPDAKCCTYQPELPNYLVGGLLADRSRAMAEGRRRLRDRIRSRVGVAPWAVMPSPRFRLLYRHGIAGFGRSQALVCPWFDRERANCTVWAWRESLCTTWFCKHVAGADGLLFWEALKGYLLVLQRCLQEHVMRELGWDAASVLLGRQEREQVPERLDDRELDETPPVDGVYLALWRNWAGREDTFYRRAFAIVSELGAADIASLGGHDLGLYQALLEQKYRAMLDGPLPDRLVFNPRAKTYRTPDGDWLVEAYSGSDLRRLRTEVFELLQRFDGRRTTRQVQLDILASGGRPLGPDLLRRLVQHRLLVDPSAIPALPDTLPPGN